MYRVDGTVDLVGELQPGVETSVCYHEARKGKAKSSENRPNPTKHLSMEDINKKIDNFLAQIKARTKSPKVIDTEIKAMKTERRLLPAGDEQRDVFIRNFKIKRSRETDLTCKSFV